MRKIRHLVAATAATGLLALGGVAASGGAANAGTQHVSGCSKSGLATVGIAPMCRSAGSVNNPTSILLTVNASFLNRLLDTPASLLGLGIKDSWHLTCWGGNRQMIDRVGVFRMTGRSIMGGQRNPSTWLLRGGPTPNRCTVRSTVTALGDLTILGLGLLTVGDNVTATTAVPGAMWARDSSGRTKCATGPYNSYQDPGARITGWDCRSAMANYWIWSPNRQLVHDGLCLTNSGGRAWLRRCTGRANQAWFNAGHYRVVRSGAGGCLTVPSTRNGTQLRIMRCTGGPTQRWLIPRPARW